MTHSPTHRTFPTALLALVLVVVVAAAEVAPFFLSPKLLHQVADQYGAQARDRLLAWQGLMAKSRHLPDDEKISTVNDFFNRIRFVSDRIHWKKEDYWATPVEFLATDGGDCEDFSVAKYFTLRQLGIPEQRLKLTYVKALTLNQAHMVVTYYSTPDAIPLVLDNLNKAILSASDRTDLAPVYSFDGDGLWIAKRRGLGIKVGHADQLNLWRDLSRRMDQESD